MRTLVALPAHSTPPDDASIGLSPLISHAPDVTARLPLALPRRAAPGRLPTWTHGLLPGSPAIDAGGNDLVSAPTDQRGFNRFVDGNGDGVATVDIGAFEIQYLSPVDMIEELITIVEDLGLHRGTENSLVKKLQGALKKLTDGNTKNDDSATGELGAFIHGVEAQAGKKIASDDAAMLVKRADAIIDALEEGALN